MGGDHSDVRQFAQDRVSIGRSTACDICIDDPRLFLFIRTTSSFTSCNTGVAERHCDIELNAKGAADEPVAHIISSVRGGGTLCNSKALKPQTYFPLRSGDMLVLNEQRAAGGSDDGVVVVFESLREPALSAFAQRYVLVGEPLGTGASAQVRRCCDRRTGAMYAAKIVQKARFTSKKALGCVENEYAILKLLHHENIVKCYDTLQDSKTLYIILELFVLRAFLCVLSHGDVLSQSQRRRSVQETDGQRRVSRTCRQEAVSATAGRCQLSPQQKHCPS